MKLLSLMCDEKVLNNMTDDKIMRPAKLFQSSAHMYLFSFAIQHTSPCCTKPGSPGTRLLWNVGARQHMLADLVCTGQSREEGAAWPSAKKQFRDLENWLPLWAGAEILAALPLLRLLPAWPRSVAASSSMPATLIVMWRSLCASQGRK